jgi:hypothetical protein
MTSRLAAIGWRASPRAAKWQGSAWRAEVGCRRLQHFGKYSEAWTTPRNAILHLKHCELPHPPKMRSQTLKVAQAARSRVCTVYSSLNAHDALPFRPSHARMADSPSPACLLPSKAPGAYYGEALRRTLPLLPLRRLRLPIARHRTPNSSRSSKKSAKSLALHGN